MSTIITWFNTPEGFVIASDGRSRDSESGKILTEDAQKIFPVEKQTTARLAYALAGTIRIGEAADQVIFDFDIEATRTFRDTEASGNWFDYVSAITTVLNGALNLARQNSGSTLTLPTETWLFILGFYGRHRKGAHVVFRHKARATEAEVCLHPPGFNHGPFGSGRIFELLDNEDPRFGRLAKPKRKGIATLSQAVERARNDVLAHCDPKALEIDEETCRGIGGRIQVATITFTAGFRWVPGFEPAS